jgi:D-amino peptidase
LEKNMSLRNVLLTLLVCVLVCTITAGAQEKKLKIYISVDMEGITGIVTSDQLGPGGFEYERFREFATAEVRAAIEAAFEAGATEVVVSDSHGNGENLLLEKLPQNITLVRAWPRPLMMMQGIDDTFAGAILLGYHASTSNPRGVRAHTISSGRFAEVKLNGIVMSEAAINAAIAGQFNVPVIMMSGDDAAVEEATKQLGDIEGAVVKWSYGFQSARTLMPEAARNLIREKVKKAIERIRSFKPYKLNTPVQLDLRFKNYRPAEILSYLPGVERTDSHSIRFVGKDIVEISKFLEFLMEYGATLEP